MSSKQKVRVAVIYGGKSGEHDVSLLSARSVIRAMDPDKYEVVPIGISTTGKWLQVEESLGLISDGKAIEHLPVIQTSPILKGNLPSTSLLSEKVDVIFPVLHGTNGEDGTIQGMLELMNLPYVGAGVMASAVGMDKIFMKRIFKEAGLPQGDFVGYLRRDVEQRMDEVVNEIEARFGFPCFVKPANLGSSVGISKAKNHTELIEALKLACRYDRKIIVEQFINGREIELAVLGNENPLVSVPGEVVPYHEFYDYKSKYLDDKTQLIIPADVSEEQKVRLQELAIKAFQAIDGAGLSRVDFFLDRHDGEIYLNEINTMPGFTPYSMYPLLWQASGLSYGELIDRLIQLAIDRFNEENRSSTDYTFE